MLIIIQFCGKKKTFVAKFSFIYLVENFNYNFDLIYLERRIFKFLRIKDILKKRVLLISIIVQSVYVTPMVQKGQQVQDCKNDAELTQIFVLKERANK